MNNTTKNPTTQDDILVFDFGLSLLMWKDRQLWIRLDDVMGFMNDAQIDRVISRGIGMMACKEIGGVYVLYDHWIDAAPPKAKPALLEVKRRMLRVIRQGAGK